MIVERVGRSRPDLALDLMWRFMGLSGPVINRVDDSNGAVGAVFRKACNDLGALAVKAKPEPVALAEHVFAAVTKNDYGEFDSLIVTVAAASPTNFARVLRRCRPLLIDGRCGDGWHGERRRFAWRRP